MLLCTLCISSVRFEFFWFTIRRLQHLRPGKKEKKEKTVRAKTAFMFFMAERRKAIAAVLIQFLTHLFDRVLIYQFQENPGASFGDIQKILSSAVVLSLFLF